MKIKDTFEYIGNGFMYVLTITQTKEIFQIISLVLSILISVLILLTKIFDWWKKAKSDGKITKEEIKELVDTTKEDVENIKNNFDKFDKGDK